MYSKKEKKKTNKLLDRLAKKENLKVYHINKMKQEQKQMKMNLRKAISFYGYLMAVGMTILFFYLIFRAYIGGFDHIIYINMYGEAHIEWFVMCTVLCLVLIGFYYYLKDLKIVHGG